MVELELRPWMRIEMTLPEAGSITAPAASLQTIVKVGDAKVVMSVGDVLFASMVTTSDGAPAGATIWAVCPM
jgi:hypothetical protein